MRRENPVILRRAQAVHTYAGAMEILMVLLGFVAVSIGVMWCGVKLVRLSTRRRVSDAPTAQIANPQRGERVYGGASRAVTTLLRPVGVMAGLGMIASPFLAIYGLFSAMQGFGSKGRVLRIKNRAQLASPALGDGWSDAEPDELRTLARALGRTERKALGDLWLLTARMEHASVAAFSQLSIHLTALGAPADLLEATHRAALEEIRHARACFAIARAITGEAHTAGPMAALGGSQDGAIDVTRLAVGSLIDGCLAEGIAADVAARSAARAEVRPIRDTLAQIARDEAGHAELAWDVLAWCLAHDEAARDAVAARVEVLRDELAPRLPDLPGASADTLRRYGVIDQDALGELATARIAAVQLRARRMLAGELVARAA